MKEPILRSEIEVASVKGKSRVISTKSVQPLKIFNPESYSHTCHVMFSNYGGGMVSGDKINIAINCQDGTNLFLNTQANGRVYKTVGQDVSEQNITGSIGKNALVVFFPDPVVLHEGSTFHQKQQWNIQNSSLLFLVDWYNSGRTDAGEKFKFNDLKSDLRVNINGKLRILDRFSFDPKTNIPDSPSNFQNYQTFLSAFWIGNEEDARFVRISKMLLDLKTKEASDLHFDVVGKNTVVSVSNVKEGVIILRALGKNRADLEDICQKILGEFSKEDMMNYNSLKRRY